MSSVKFTEEEYSVLTGLVNNVTFQLKDIKTANKLYNSITGDGEIDSETANILLSVIKDAEIIHSIISKLLKKIKEEN